MGKNSFRLIFFISIVLIPSLLFVSFSRAAVLNFFNEANEIIRTDNIYLSFFNYIPEDTFITMTVSNVTDNKGLELVSGSILLNDDDKDGMADDWEAKYGIGSAFSDPDSDGLYNRSELYLRYQSH
jgi:hypothetical protein